VRAIVMFVRVTHDSQHDAQYAASQRRLWPNCDQANVG
jgi:hypothetical protein